MSTPYRITVAADNSPISEKTIQYAIQLCSKLVVPYTLEILYAVGLNPTTAPVGFMNGLDRMNNIDIQRDAQESVTALNAFLAQFDETKSTTVTVQESIGDVGCIITDHINQNPPDMLVVGSTNKEGIQKFILGSVSDYCLHHCECPVTVIKNNRQPLDS